MCEFTRLCLFLLFKHVDVIFLFHLLSNQYYNKKIDILASENILHVGIFFFWQIDFFQPFISCSELYTCEIQYKSMQKSDFRFHSVFTVNYLVANNNDRTMYCTWRPVWFSVKRIFPSLLLLFIKSFNFKTVEISKYFIYNIER